MPVYEVEVTRTASVSDTVIVQADDEEAAHTLAAEAAADWDYNFEDTEIGGVTELSADEALDKANEVVTA